MNPLAPEPVKVGTYLPQFDKNVPSPTLPATQPPPQTPPAGPKVGDYLPQFDITKTQATQTTQIPEGYSVSYKPTGAQGEVQIKNADGTTTFGVPPVKKDITSTGTTPVDTKQAELDKKNKEWEDTAKTVYNTINGITNGTIPLNAGEQAQVQGLQQQYQSLIDEQKQVNKNSQGIAQLRGYQTGSAEYDPTFQAKAIGAIINTGLNKVATLTTKMAGAVAELTSALKKNDIANIKSAWDAYNEMSTKRTEALQKSIENTQKAMETAQKENLSRIVGSLVADAGLTDTNEIVKTLNKLGVKYDSENLKKVLDTFNPQGTGIISEYNLYKKEAIAAGQNPLGFNDYQTMDANRKAQANAAFGDSNLSSKQAAIFNSIVDKYNKSPLVAANDRTLVLKDIIKSVKDDPTNGAKQLSLVYGYVQALDTYQSAVREGELSLVNSIDSKIGQFTNSIQKIRNGQIVREDVIKQIADAAQGLVNTIENGAKQKQKSFSAQAAQNGTAVKDAFEEYTRTLNSLAPTTGSDLVKSETEATNSLTKYKTNNPTKVGELTKAISSLEKILGRPATSVELLEAYPEFK